MKTREQFWRKVLVAGPDDCWEWMGGSLSNGYGKVWWGGKEVTTHRLVAAWRLERDLASDEVVRHLCDNPGCVNPNHLKVGTQGENMADRDAKGRNTKGRKIPRLSPPVIEEMRAKHRAGRSILGLTRDYGVSWERAKRIVA